MSGTNIGGQKAHATMKEHMGELAYKEYITAAGRKGGQAIAKTPRGFAADHERARTAGSKGGKSPRKKRDE